VINRVRTLRASDLLSPHVLVIAGIVAIMVATFAVIIASLNRGFDWTDEGFVYAMIASNHVSTNEYWGFHYLLGPLYELLGGSVLVFRILRLLGYVVLGIALTLLAREILRRRGIALGRVGWFLVGLVAQVGTVGAWTYPPRYLGYNELAGWLSQIGIALLIFLLLDGHGTAQDHSARRMRMWPWLWSGVGVVTSILLVAKISAGVFLLLLAITTTAFAVGPKVWWKVFLALAGGAVGGFLLMLAGGAPLSTYAATIGRFAADPSAQADSGHSITELLVSYLGSASTTVGALAIPILLAGAIMVVVRGVDSAAAPALRVIRSVENVTLLFAFVLATILISINVFQGTLGSWPSLGVSTTFLLVVALLALAVLATLGPGTRYSSRRRTVSALIVAGFLFAIGPLISALGTDNNFFGHTVFSSTLWAVGAAVGLVLLWQRSEAITAAARLLPVLLLGVIVASAGIAVAGEVFVHPYRSTPYFTQNSMVKVGDLRGIQLTPGEAELYTWLHDAGLRHDAHSVPTLSLATPGALLAFNASGWTAIWPGPAWTASIAKTCSHSVPDDLIVLQSQSESEGTIKFERLATGLDACGIEFPHDFTVVDHHTSDDPVHDVLVWRLT